jgi:potassium efflux system protein
MRATTITDWDHKEVIIPNKNFITGQLINWSLSDAITRVVIKVGIAYGSDVQQARKLLQAIAADNSKVLQNPSPEAFFIAFGDCSLDFELRIYVSNMSDRMQVADEVNSQIDEQFRQLNIVIAVPQLDVNITHQKDS